MCTFNFPNDIFKVIRLNFLGIHEMVAFLWVYFRFKGNEVTTLSWFACDFPVSQTESPASWGPFQSHTHGGQPVILEAAMVGAVIASQTSMDLLSHFGQVA